MCIAEFKAQYLDASKVLEYQVTCLLLASKLNEIDERIIYLSDLLSFIKNMLLRRSDE